MSKNKPYKLPEVRLAEKIQEDYNSTDSARKYGAVAVSRIEEYLSVGRFSVITDNEPGPALDHFCNWVTAEYADLLAVVDKYKYIRFSKH